jgi:preprotein translocase subunit YajC
MGLLAHFAVLAADSSTNKKSSFPFTLVILPLMFGALYLLMIRPQRQRAAAQQRTMRQVEVGDEIQTTSGMYGIVTAMDDEDLWLEVAEGVEVRVARAALMKVTQRASEVSDDADTTDASGVIGRGAPESTGAIDAHSDDPQEAG